MGDVSDGVLGGLGRDCCILESIDGRSGDGDDLSLCCRDDDDDEPLETAGMYRLMFWTSLLVSAS